MFDYSKCTYKELNKILERFNKKAFNCKNKEYKSIAKEECFLLVSELNKSKCRDRYIKTFSNINSLDSLSEYHRIIKHNDNLADKDIILECIELRMKETKRINSFKESNKRRFLLKGRYRI